MTDHALRRLERTWRETVSPDAERAFRLAEVRAGVRTRESLADQAVLQLSVRVADREALARLIDRDPLLEHLRQVRSDRLFGPSEPYLRDALNRVQAETQIHRAPRAIGPAVRHLFEGKTEVTQRYRWINRSGAFAQLTCRCEASRTPGLSVQGALVGVSGECESSAVAGLRAEHFRIPYRNGLAVELISGAQHPVDSGRYSFRTAGRLAFVRASAALAVTHVPWVRVASGQERPLSHALNQGEWWEFLEWRVLSVGAARGRLGSD